MAARHNPRCPLCGAPTRALSFRDGNAWSCTDCEALTVEGPTARQLLGAAAPTSAPPPALLEPTAPLPDSAWASGAAVERRPNSGPPPAPATDPRPITVPPPARPDASGEPTHPFVAAAPEAAPAPGRRPSPPPAAVETPPAEAPRSARGRPPRRRPSRTPAGMMLGIAASLALLVLAVPASVLVYRVARDRAASQRDAAPPAVALAETLGGPAPPVVLPDPEPVELPPEPEPVPTDQAPSQSSLVRQGWDLVESSPARAVDAFEAALRSNPGDAEAQYGLGYAMLQAGDRAAGARWLCAAVPSGSPELRREVQSLLDHHQLTCSP